MATPPAQLQPLVICGPSGVGKGTLIERLRAAMPGRFGFSVSHTTRAPRPGEEDGVAYHFVALETMKAEVEAAKFIEHAEVHGNMYGTSKAAVEAVQQKGQICILDIDVQGVKQVKASGAFDDAKFLFIAPPSVEDLEQRLRGRGTENEDKIQVRLKNAKGELDFCEENRDYFNHVLVNADLTSSTRELLSLLRGWYPTLKQLMKVTAQRSMPFYVRAARELLVEKPERPPPAELEVQALGNAIPRAAAVVGALSSDGHKVVRVQSDMVEVSSDALKRKLQTPRISVILQCCAATA